MPTVNVLGAPVCADPAAAMVAAILGWAAQPPPAPGPRLVFATGVHGLVLGARESAFRAVLRQAAMLVPDGMPLVWVGRREGGRAMERLRGTDLMRRVCAGSAERGIRHYLYGGAPGVAEGAARALERMVGSLRIVGMHAPPFRSLSEQERGEDAARINASGAEVVWVGLGTPKQERWAAAARSRLRAGVVITVGAAFDFLAGTAREPPRWIQRSGFEWLYRALAHPRRLGPRYLRTVPWFLLLAAGQLSRLVEFEDGGR